MESCGDDTYSCEGGDGGVGVEICAYNFFFWKFNK